MEKDDIKNRETVQQITNQIWGCADILRVSLMDNSLHVVLFLISAYKDQVLLNPKFDNQGNWFNHFRDIVYQDSFYSKVYVAYAPILENIKPSQLQKVIQHIEAIDRNLLRENFEDVFEYLLQKLIDFQGKLSGESIQPKEITRLIFQLANLKDNAKVYNPFAGLASFGINLNENQEYHGQEINQSTWAIGKLRLRAHGRGNGYEQNDSIENWLEGKKFDLIVATPPFGYRIKNSKKYSAITDTRLVNLDSFLIDKGLNSINLNGQLICVLSLSFLYRGGRETKLKKSLIKNDLIETIVTLPSGLLSNTNIPICIMVFKTISKRPGYIKLINASSFFIKDGPRNKVLDDSKLFQLINQDSENEFMRYVSSEEVYKNDFDLSVGRYFLKEIQGEKLSDFSSIIRGFNAPVNTSMKQVQIRNLKDDVFDSILSSEELEYSLIKRPTFRVIEESCLLIATRWNTLKPTYFRYSGEPIVISSAIAAIKIEENFVDPMFLVNEFSADYVIEQVNSYRVGSVQPMLRKKDLVDIVFQLPTMQEQKAKVSGIIELSKRLRKIESEKESILSGIKEEETESSTSLSHILGKPLLSIGSSLEIIQIALSKLDPDWESKLISENRQFTLSDAFDSISKNVKYIQELADENTSLVSVSNFELDELHFLKFISEFVKNEKKSLKDNISLYLDIHEDIKQQMDNQVLIKGNPQKLRIVLVNLLDNAKSHGFTNKEQANKIIIEILPFTGNEQEASNLNYDIDGRKSYVEVKVSNTGTTFPKDFKLKDYVRKNFAAGKTRNKGLGGYEVNEILKTHNEGKNSLNIVSNKSDAEYSTTISFVIPII